MGEMWLHTRSQQSITSACVSESQSTEWGAMSNVRTWLEYTKSRPGEITSGSSKHNVCKRKKFANNADVKSSYSNYNYFPWGPHICLDYCSKVSQRYCK